VLPGAEGRWQLPSSCRASATLAGFLDAPDKVRNAAFGWDRQWLLTSTRDDQGNPAMANIDAAFLGWVRTPQ